MALGFSTLNHSTMFGGGTGLADQVRAAATAGFDLVALDIFSLRHAISEGRLGDLVASIDESGIEVLDICALAMNTDADSWATELEEVVAAARMLAARHVMVRFDAPIDATAIARSRRAATQLADAGVAMVVEPSPLSVVHSIGAARQLLADIGSGRGGLVIDSWHFSIGAWPWHELAAAVADVAYVQIADGVAASEAALMEQTLHHRRQPGEGDFDLPRFVHALTTAGYRGPWCAEVLNDAQRHEPIAGFAARTYRHLAALCGDG